MAPPDPRPARRYLDNAATSWPKPEEVWGAWQRAARENGVAPGRGGYREAIEADRVRNAARAAAAGLIGCRDASRVAMPSGATLGLNLAIRGLVSRGDRVVTTAADHNATLRPLHAMVEAGLIRLSVVPCDSLGRADPAAIAAAVREGGREGGSWIVCTHASNVTGAMQDAAAIAAIARSAGAGLILDASQSVGVVPIDVETLGIDCLVAPAHKWLLGMAGAAILYVREGLEPDCVIAGGTGTESGRLTMPGRLCDRLEPGTPDLPALAALEAAIRWHSTEAAAALGRARNLADGLAEGLRSVEGVRVHAAGDGPPIVSFEVEGYAPAEVAAVLERMAGVQVRAGFHCAALAHGPLGAAEGTVRASLGPFNTADDCLAVVEGARRLAKHG